LKTAERGFTNFNFCNKLSFKTQFGEKNLIQNKFRAQCQYVVAVYQLMYDDLQGE
jgi:hypothetical protein